MIHPLDAELGGLALPEPDADAVDASLRLVSRIRERIERHDGVIGFDEFMRMALYQPGLGYYSAGASKLGAGGDFVTAPEISVLFGDCLARQLAALIDQGCAPAVLEFGAGSGRLCAQIMQALPGIERYQLLDLSADLKQRQRDYLRRHLDDAGFGKLEWLQTLPPSYDGIVLANEVVDAMPVHRVEKQERWFELGVGFGDSRFEWRRIEPAPTVRSALAEIEARLGALAAGYRSEINLNLRPWMRALADSCGRAALLIIDYGYEQPEYYHPSRSAGTLVCHYRHRVHDDPLIYPGLQDITAFVDFDAVADAGEAAGFEAVGLVTQAEFLLANGLLEAAEKRAAASDDAGRIGLAQQVKTLTLAQEMGEKFKVLALQKGLDLDIPAMRRGAAYG